MRKTLWLACIVTFLLSSTTTSAWPGKKKDTEATAAAKTNVAAGDSASTDTIVVMTSENVVASEPAPTTTAVATPPAPAPVKQEVAPQKTASAPSNTNKSVATKKKTTTTSNKKVAPRASTKKSTAASRSKTATAKRPAPAEKPQQASTKPAVSQKPTPAEQQVRAQAQKSVPTASMSETKAYELFKDGNYDVAAPYFARMADEKRFVFTDDMSFEHLDNIVRKYVDAQMAKFLVKGEFEKTAAYVVRINEENRNKKIQAFANTIFDDLKARERKMVSIRDFKLSRYYADDESFLLSSPVGDYVLDVEMAGARSFKSNFYKLQLKELDFSADTSGILVLSRFTIVNPENSKRYIFNSGMPTQYNATELEKFYTGRLGSGTPKATQAVSDTIKAFHSIVPSTSPTPADSTAAATRNNNSFGSGQTQTTAAAASTSETASTGTPQKPEAAVQPATPVEEAKVKISGDEMTLEN